MREILFRGKRIDNGEWVYGNLVVTKRLTGTTYRITSIEGIDYGKGYSFVVDPTTIGQDTGLTDKNGKKIFEGDIVREDSYSIGRIYVDEDCCELRIKYSDKRLFKEKMISKVTSYHLYEVIGNIHDNPELLEVGE